MNKQNQKSSNDSRHYGKWAVVGLLKVLALFPLSCLYVISDVLYILTKTVFKYRHTIITDNLRHAFPDKDKREIRYIRDRFYRYFCDVTIESIKLYNLSVKQLEKRIQFSGVDQLNEFAQERNGAVLLAFHYNNWEWSSALQLKLNCRVLMVYNKMRDNRYMDEFLLKAREKCGGEAIQMGRAAKVAYQYRAKKVPVVIGLIADQSALASSQMWTEFFNREATFFSGPVKIAQKTNQPLFFQHVVRLGRGKYEYKYTLLADEPAKMSASDLLLLYVEKMEEVIKTNPEYYLWSHKRWKHKRPEGTALIQ